MAGENNESEEQQSLSTDLLDNITTSSPPSDWRAHLDAIASQGKAAALQVPVPYHETLRKKLSIIATETCIWLGEATSIFEQGIAEKHSPFVHDMETMPSQLIDAEARERATMTAEVPARLAAAAIATYIDNLSLMVRSSATALPLEVITRSIVETSGLVYWLLDVDISGEKRLIRALLLMYKSAFETEAVATAQGMLGQGYTTPAFVRDRIDLYGFDWKLQPGSNANPILIDGEKLPPYTQRAKAVLSAVGVSESTYKMYSGTVHGEIFGILGMYTNPRQIGGKRIQFEQFRIGAAWSAVALAVGLGLCCRDLIRNHRGIPTVAEQDGKLLLDRLAKIKPTQEDIAAQG